MQIIRIPIEKVTVKSFDVMQGEYYEIIGPDDGESVILECLKAGVMVSKYVRLKNRNVWILKSADNRAEVLFCEKLTERQNGHS